jgi:hypothetical protein
VGLAYYYYLAYLLTCLFQGCPTARDIPAPFGSEPTVRYYPKRNSSTPTPAPARFGDPSGFRHERAGVGGVFVGAGLVLLGLYGGKQVFDRVQASYRCGQRLDKLFLADARREQYLKMDEADEDKLARYRERFPKARYENGYFIEAWEAMLSGWCVCHSVVLLTSGKSFFRAFRGNGT